MTNELDDRVRELEARLQRLDDDVRAERERRERERRRERWARIVLLVIVGGAYVLYLRFVAGLA